MSTNPALVVIDKYADWREVYRFEVSERVKHWGDKRLGGKTLYREEESE